jgi:hypothetical protein
MVQMLSRPASSAVVAILATIGPICAGGHGQENLVMPIPSFMLLSTTIVSRITNPYH